MNRDISVMGAGGKIAAVLVISLAVTAGVSFLFRPLFSMTGDFHRLALIAAATAAAGFALNLVAAFGMLNARRKGRLATGGMYAVFLHPMYTFLVFITVPGLLLFFNSWLVMLAAIPAFIAFKVFAKEEERYLEERFGDQYREYRKKVIFR